MSSILNDCVANFSVSNDYDRLKHIKVTVTHPQHGHIASLSAIQIDRNRCRSSFLEVVDEHSNELKQFGTKLFDKNGKLMPWFVENDHHKGTGCWGFELNNGIIMYVLRVDVIAVVCFLILRQLSFESDTPVIVPQTRHRIVGPTEAHSIFTCWL